jgi:hypothetical protein
MFFKYVFNVMCIFSVVTSCNELEHFDFSGCDLVTNATVQAALDSVTLRTNNVKLTLVVGGELNHSGNVSIFLVPFGHRVTVYCLRIGDFKFPCSIGLVHNCVRFFNTSK